MLDPARLLRKSWTNADELAKELFVLLSRTGAEAPPEPPARPLPLSPGRAPAAQPFGEEAALVRLRPRHDAFVFGSPRLPAPSRNPITADEVRKVFELPTTIIHPLPPAPPPPPGLTRVDNSPRGAKEVAPPRGETRAETLKRIRETVPEMPRPTPYTGPRIIRAGSPVGKTFEPFPAPAEPIAGPAHRTLPPTPPSAPPTTPYSLATEPPIPTGGVQSTQVSMATPVPLADFAPIPEGLRQIDLTTGRPYPEPPPKRDPEQYDFTPDREPYGENTLRLAFIGPDGIPGAVKTEASGQTGTYPTFEPGSGQGVFFDFDADQNELAYLTDSNVKFYNYSQLPVSGSQLVPVFLMLGQFWVQPPDFAHGKIGVQSFPCTTDVPDQTGFVQTMYMKNGVMTFDQNIKLESWFNVTALVGKHCSVKIVDGLISLEVLDC